MAKLTTYVKSQRISIFSGGRTEAGLHQVVFGARTGWVPIDPAISIDHDMDDPADHRGLTPMLGGENSLKSHLNSRSKPHLDTRNRKKPWWARIYQPAKTGLPTRSQMYFATEEEAQEAIDRSRTVVREYFTSLPDWKDRPEVMRHMRKLPETPDPNRGRPNGRAGRQIELHERTQDELWEALESAGLTWAAFMAPPVMPVFDRDGNVIESGE
jgi:hypothetical protein